MGLYTGCFSARVNVKHSQILENNDPGSKLLAHVTKENISNNQFPRYLLVRMRCCGVIDFLPISDVR